MRDIQEILKVRFCIVVCFVGISVGMFKFDNVLDFF